MRTGGKGKLSALFFPLKFAVKLKLLEEMKLINYKEIGSNNAYLPIQVIVHIKKCKVNTNINYYVAIFKVIVIFGKSVNTWITNKKEIHGIKISMQLDFI